MKQFNKWWKRRRGKVYHDDITNVVEEGWKAALEWVKSRSEYSKELYMIWANDIDEELEE